MEPKYSEYTLLRVCYTMGAIIMTAILGIAFCVVKVLDHIT